MLMISKECASTNECERENDDVEWSVSIKEINDDMLGRDNAVEFFDLKSEL